MRIFEIAQGDELEWVAADTNVHALKIYSSITDQQLWDFEDDATITELPKDEWEAHYIRGEDGLPEKTFAQWMKENKTPDIIAGTPYL
jgi:hypothetical protein